MHPIVEIKYTKSEKGTQKSVPFQNMKDEILGKKYELSVAFIGSAKMKKLNRETRDKDYVTDILSFTYSKNTGEIFLCLPKIKNKASEFDMDTKNYLKFLVIHGMLHLKGMDHGSTMERMEDKWKKVFSVKSFDTN